MDLVATHGGPLVGRDVELSTLTAALAAAAEGAPGAVLVSGDAGAGKTRLLTALAEQAAAAGDTVLIGHCPNLGSLGLPYLPFSEALEGLGVGRAVTDAGQDDVGQLRLFDTVARTLSDAARERPVLLIVEDLHWSDQSTLHLIAFLLARVRDERLLFVGSYRNDDLHRRHPLRPLITELTRLPHVQRLDLAPFQADDMAAYLKSLRGAPVPVSTVLRILDRSGGNAYFAQELLEGEQEGRSELPPALADVLLGRVETLAPDGQLVARAASAAGRRVEHGLLRRVSGLRDDALEQALREAVLQHVLVPEGRESFGFRHALLQEAIYADLLPGERGRLHGAYAEAIEASGGPAALLAHHRVESHDVVGALVASVLAADEAERLHAPVEAWQQLERALRLWDAVPDAAHRVGVDLVELTMRAAGAASRAGELHRAIALARSAVDFGGAADAEVKATMLHRLAGHLLNADQERAAVVAAEEAVRLAPPSTHAAVWSAAAAARALRCVGEIARSAALAQCARDEAVAFDLPGAEADALVTLATIASREGRAKDSDAMLAVAVVRARVAGHVVTEMRATFNVALSRYDACDIAGTIEVCGPALQRCADLGVTWSPYGLEIRTLLVTALYVAGDWPASVRAAALASDRPPDAMAARLTAASLQAAVGSGSPTAGESVRALEGAWHHDPMIAILAGGHEAELLRWQGRPAEASAVIERVVGYVDDVWDPLFLAGIWLCAVGLSAVGDLAQQSRLARDVAATRRAVDDASELLDRARTTAAKGVPQRSVELGPEGKAWLLRAEAEHTRAVGNDDPAAWSAARAAFGYGHRYEQARCAGGLAEALVAHSRRDEAKVVLGEALDEARALGALPLQLALDLLAKRAGLEAGAPPRAALGALTRRELEVLELLAQGCTNKQIGERLFMSEKTASVHVSRIAAKLGAAGRTEAVSMAHRAGLLEDKSR